MGERDLSGARHSTGVWLGKVTSGSEEEDTIIGPMPAKGPVESDVTKEFERRAQRMKEKLTSADSPDPKQSWMTELPPGLKSFGFGPRTVRRGANDKSGVGSIWTDTPADRERKAKESKRSESLLDMHQKKLKSKASEEKAKPQERRPSQRNGTPATGSPAGSVCARAQTLPKPSVRRNRGLTMLISRPVN
ncbi:GPALPP motifs-containing protein 1-like protein [Aix galericulata]|nr:GPALPP motifs-containing protein 1-like protein [Aix galericulata]